MGCMLATVSHLNTSINRYRFLTYDTVRLR